MYDQAKVKPQSSSDFFKDGQGARPLVAGTVPYGHLEEDDVFYRGTQGGKATELFPFVLTESDLANGKTQYEVFCSVCHGYTGNADGMIVQRGFRQPPNFHDDRLRQAPPGYIFGVISNGFATMPAYGKMIPHKERWQIVAYLRALQASQNVRVAELSQDERAKLDEKPAKAGHDTSHGEAHSQEHH